MKQSQASLSETFMLDNPIWHALSTEQSRLAQGNALAKRFPTDVGPLGAMRDQSAAAYEALGEILSGDAIALFLETEPHLPIGWAMLYSAEMYQMICEAPVSGDETAIRELTGADVPEMLALTKLTEPGPFRPRTIELGGYLGIHDSGSLVAMAGERLHMTGFTEVSAVCTHPEFRGRGYGNALVSAVVSRIIRRGETPILHVKAENTTAVRLYERLGFKVRARLHLAVIKRGTTSAAVSPNGIVE